jgi:DNA invertase Pin-like site-specific DNA recombinase
MGVHARRVFAYLRRANPNVDIAQEDRLKSFVAENGMDLVEVFCDLPGTGIVARGATFGAMVVRLHAVKTSAIVIEALASLSEDKIEQELALGQLLNWGIEVFCITDPDLSGSDPERRLLRGLTGRTDFTKRMDALRLQGRRMAARKRTGTREGAKPYGELSGEAPVLRQIIELKGEGIGPTEIARRLNTMGITPRRGKQWHPTTVANVLGARREKAARAERKHRKKL